ncbi:MAG: hypothetical protein AVDCRST_MAG50-1595 [uncultured Acidimicrobiales bacterium]|uniref:Uncharacterized protein n=1 Tax=uncultured Acidimicrobiales bacterium TaxID=310071 RepID=A0A6J4HMF9_9ACTN|nr:MAG: hypothetical protein AVDCRST_MAG50-1595 [uncultured Acidimicrobiales bacterium]
MSQGIDPPITTGVGAVTGGAAPPEASGLPVDDGSTAQNAKEQAANVAGTAKQEASGVASAATDQTRHVASEAADAASSVASTAVEKVAEVKDVATTEVRSLVTDATAQVREQAETQAGRLAEGLTGLGDQVRALLDGRPDEAPQIRSYLEQGADRLGELAERIQSGGVDGALADVQRFARRKPGLFLLGALGLGVGVGRVVAGAKAAGPQSSSQPRALGTIDYPPAYPTAELDPTTGSPLGTGMSAGSTGVPRVPDGDVMVDDLVEPSHTAPAGVPSSYTPPPLGGSV